MILTQFAACVHSKVSLVFALVAILGSASCSELNRESSLLDGFEMPETVEEEIVLQKLSFREIPHTMVRQKVEGGQYLFDQYRYDVRFEPLSEGDFFQVKQHFGSWSKEKSEIAYEAGRKYSLKDFLPPTIQALLNFRFEAETTSFTDKYGSEVEATTLANCWGTMYEVLRTAQEGDRIFSLFYAHDDVMKKFLFDSQYSRLIKAYSRDLNDYKSAELRNKNLKPGDVIVIGQDYIYHVAIFLDDDLFFEKSGSGDKTLFRLTTYETLSKTWYPEIYGWSVRRFDQVKLPDPMTLFGLQAVFAGQEVTQRFSSEQSQNLSAVQREAPNSSEFFFFLRKYFQRNYAGRLVPLSAD